MKSNEIKKRTLKRSTISVNPLAVGTYSFGGSWGEQSDDDSLMALHAAIDNGVNLIDTAQAYGAGRAERIVGEFLDSYSEEVVVSTKIPPLNHRWAPPEGADFLTVYPPDYLQQALEKSLRRLKRDYIDVLFLHTWAKGFEVYDEWKDVFSEWKTQGLVKLAGISTIDLEPEVVNGAIETGLVDIVQLPMNIFDQEVLRTVLPVAAKYNVSLFARSPLDQGALTGKFTEKTTFRTGDFRNKFFNKDNFYETLEKVQELELLRLEYFPDLSLFECAVLFCLSQDVSAVLVGVRNQKQAKALSSIQGKLFTEQDLKLFMKFCWPRRCRQGVTN